MGRRVLGLCALAATMAACTPADQAAVTVDERTGAPVLVLALCPEEGVEAVRLSVAATDEDSLLEEGELLWRVEADAPERVTQVVAGVVPPGFTEEVALADLPPRRPMVMVAEVTGGLAAEHGESLSFRIADLSPGRLMQFDLLTSRDDLLGTAKANCSSNPLAAIGVSPLVQLALLGAFGLVCTTAFVGWLLVMRRHRRSVAP